MKIRPSFLLILGVCVLSAQICFGQLTAGESAAISRLSDKLNNDLKFDKLHGSISATIIKNDHIIWSGAFGYAGVNSEAPADTNTIYRIGSITKTFTAVILLQLVDEGKLQLDDPLEKYVPEAKSLNRFPAKSPITLRQLASHTSGLMREPTLGDASTGPVNQWENKVLACIPHTFFAYAPGTHMLYSNIGFALLGLALERATGVPYISMVEHRILDPLNMDDTFFSVPADKMPRLAQGINNNDENHIDMKFPVWELAGRGYRVPNGGIFSTPRDLAKFVIALIKGNVLMKRKSFRDMQEVPPGGQNYGLGISIARSVDIDAIGHAGSVAGYTSQFLVEQRRGYAVILMRNYNNGITQLALDAQNLLVQLLNKG